MAESTPTEKLELAAEFPAASREQWLRLVEGVLKGRPFEKLVARSYDGLTVGPLSERARDTAPIPGRIPPAVWRIQQRVDNPNPADANAQALRDLAEGADGLVLVLPGSVGAYGFGVPAQADALDRVLEGVHLEAGISLEIDQPPVEVADQAIVRLLEKRGLSPGDTEIHFGFDPFGAGLAQGWTAEPWPAAAPKLAQAVIALSAKGFRGPFVAADARPIHAAGGSEAQELGYALSAAVAYLRALADAGMLLEDAARAIFFRFASDADQFLSIAKLRAIRKLWARVAEACGIVPPRAFVSAETAWRMMTRRDAHVNMLRTTMAAFSAAAGGADAITVLPFTAALGLPDDFARRIARNTQALLAEESHLAKVSDPAAGAGAVEDLTRQLCDAAWSLFQEFERAGGVAATLEAGLLQRKVAATRAAREKAIARRADVLTGTSEFPNLGEAVPAVLDCPPPPRAIVPASVVRFMPLPPKRLSEPFEALRDRSDRSLAASGKRPQVFLALLGTIAESTPRTTFARGFFAAGGIEAIESEAAAGADAIARAFAASGAKMACLCSSDEVYAREAAGTAAALKAAGAGTVYLAGRPSELEAALRNAGVDAFIYAGCDVLGSLEDAYARAGL